MPPRLPPDIIDVDALTDEESEDGVLCTGFGMNGRQASFTGKFSSLVTQPTRQPAASSSRLPAPRGPPQPNLQATNNYLFIYARPTPLDMAEQERKKKRTAMDLRESPSKKPATTSTIAKANVPSRQKDKRKQQCLEEEDVEIIDLCSSDDDTQAKKPKILFEDNNMEVDRKPVIYANDEDPLQMEISDNVRNNDPNNSFLRTNTPLPQPSSFQEPECDSEEEYVNYMASLNISNEFNWKPVSANNKAEDLSRNAAVEIEPSRPPELRPLRPKYFAVHYPVTPTDPDFKDSDKFIWGQLNSIRGLRPRLKPPPRLRIASYVPLMGRTRSLPLFQDLGYNKLGVVESHRQAASGSVNKIIQVQGAIVACAAASGGQANYSQEDREAPLPTDNNAGTLVVLHQDRCHVVDAHCIDHTASSKKYYTVNDVSFNPLNPQQFASTGNDFKVQLWQLPKVDEMETSDFVDGPWMLNSVTLENIAQDLVYSSDGTILAVSCRDGTVSIFKTVDLFTSRTAPPPKPKTRLRAVPVDADHAAGTVVWGSGPTERHIYTSSEPYPDSEGGDKGFHRAHDASRSTQLFCFDAKESGDAGAISPDGRSYALITSGENNQHPLRLYDVARGMGRSVAEVTLEPSVARDASFEVAKATFSSEGRLLAVARSDNALHMYDVRALSKGPLAMFQHDELDAVGSAGFGVVQASWVEGRDCRRVGIVSGGNDGCVRLWDPSIASSDKSQGRVLARREFDVAYFSMGDMREGEKPLVLGHCGGGLYVYDFLDGDGLPIASQRHRRGY